MSEFIASAEIAIIPNTREFRLLLKQQLQDATKTPVPIKVTVSGAGFERDLRRVVRDATQNVRANVLVRADITGFERDLRTKVKAVAERVSANVKVTAGTARQTTTGGVGGAPRPRKPAPVLSDTGKPLFGAAAQAKTAAREREAAELKALEKIQAAEIKAHIHNLGLDKARAAADEKARLKVLADLEKQGLLSKTGKPLTGAARDAKLEANARKQALLDAQAEVDADHARALKENTRRERQAIRDLRDDQLAATRAIAAQRARIAAAPLETRRAEERLRGARDFVGEGNTALLRARSRLAAATKAVEAAEDAFTFTIGTNDRALQLHAATVLRDARALEFLQRELVQTQILEDKETAAARRRQGFGARGFAAQIASFAGLRGAVLSANSAFIAGTVAAITFGKAIQTATQFETELNTFAAVSGATANEMERVSAAAKQLGADLTLPGVNAVDAAQGIALLSKAGLSVEDTLGGIRGTLQLATAANIENAAAVEITASALNAFNLEGFQAVEVADALANAANSSQGSIEDMGIALQQSATVARQVGLNLQQTLGVLTLFARAGLKGSDAGTSLRTMLLRLVNPTAKAQAIIDDLGLSIRDQFGRLNLSFFTEFAEKTENLTKRQREQKLAIITGQDAIRGATILMREGAAALEFYTAKMGESGTASDIAAARTKGLAGGVENLKNQLATTGSAIGTLLLPGLTDLANVLAGVVGGIGAVVEELTELNRIASKPIDIVVNVIRKVTGAEEPEEGEPQDVRKEDIGGLVSGIIDIRRSGIDIGKDFFQLGIELNAQLEEGLGVNTVRFPRLTEARQQIRDLLTEFNKSDKGAVAFNTLVVGLQQMQKEMAKGTFGTKEFAKSLGPFIKQLQELSDNSTIPIDIQFPKSLLEDAASFEQQARVSGSITRDQFVEGFSQGLLPTLQEIGKKGMEAVAAGMVDPGAKGAIAAALKATFQAAGRDAGIEEELDILTIAGASPARRRAKLVQQAATQQAIIDESNVIGAAGDALKRRRAARQKLAGIMTEIRQIDEEAEADAKKKADDAQKARDEADQALLDSFAPAERRVERQATLAERTPGVQDDIAAARARKRQLLLQISVIRADFNDRKAAAEEIFKRRQEIISIEDQIAADTKTARDQITQTLAKRIELAQLQGGRGAILKAIDRAIADAKDRVKHWKRLGLVLLDEQILLARLVKQRKDFLKEIGPESPDVFVDRLFREAVDQFRRFGGNISVANQGTGIISPQGARGEFARILTGGGRNIPDLNQSTAQRTREQQLSEAKKQTGYLQIIAGGPKTKFVKGTPLPPEATKVAREIADNVLRGL